MPFKDKEKGREYRHRYYKENKEEIHRKKKIHYWKNREKILVRHRKYNQEYDQREHIKERRREYAKGHKIEISQYLKEYYKNNIERMRQGRERYYQNNREVFIKRAKERYPEYKEKQREAKLIKKFGIDSNQYKKLLLKQKGVCAVCSKPESSRHQCGTLRMLAVDHNHKTGRIRGLLCSRCNNGIGLLGDDIRILKKAVKYLK